MNNIAKSRDGKNFENFGGRISCLRCSYRVSAKNHSAIYRHGRKHGINAPTMENEIRRITIAKEGKAGAIT